MIKLIKSLFDYLYKRKCCVCFKNSDSELICPECLEEINNKKKLFKINLQTVEVFSLFEYKEEIRAIIRSLKYKNKQALAEFLADIFAEILSEINLNKKEKIEVLFVPSHKKRIKKRRFDHMKEVAQILCKKTGLTLNDKLLKRVKDTKPQFKLTMKERRENLNDAFEVDLSQKREGIFYIIIDDILTTGATLSEIIRTLKKEDIHNMVCLTSSHTMFDKN